jgi:hypothetical protein
MRCGFERGHSAELTGLQVAVTITTITVLHWLAHTHTGVYLDTKGVINTPSGSMIRVVLARRGTVVVVGLFRHGKTHTQQNIKTNHSKVGLCGIHGQCPPPEAMPKFLAYAKISS